ncbi:MAG: thioredoxin family protein [Candidatus Accumulibacter sp.]|jgi:thioredoxin-related protein|nr:thioredoxin family protein [Accumulibacter sp.]
MTHPACTACTAAFSLRRYARLFFLFFFVFFTSAPAFAALFGVEVRDLAAEVRHARAEGRRLVVFFELPDCPNCLKMKREVFSSPKAEKDFGRAYRSVRVNLASPLPLTDTRGVERSVLEVAEVLHISGAPSFAFFAHDGSLEYRYTGEFLRVPEFLRLGRYVAEARYEEHSFYDYKNLSSKH